MDRLHHSRGRQGCWRYRTWPWCRQQHRRLHHRSAQGRTRQDHCRRRCKESVGRGATSWHPNLLMVLRLGLSIACLFLFGLRLLKVFLRVIELELGQLRYALELVLIELVLFREGRREAARHPGRRCDHRHAVVCSRRNAPTFARGIFFDIEILAPFLSICFIADLRARYANHPSTAPQSWTAATAPSGANSTTKSIRLRRSLNFASRTGLATVTAMEDRMAMAQTATRSPSMGQSRWWRTSTRWRWTATGTVEKRMGTHLETTRTTRLAAPIAHGSMRSERPL